MTTSKHNSFNRPAMPAVILAAVAANPAFAGLRAHARDPNAIPAAVLRARHHFGPLAQLPDANERRGAGVVIAELQASIEQFKANHGDLQTGFQAAIDDINAKIAAINTGGSVISTSDAPVDPVYTRDFLDFVRAGENELSLRAANRTGRLAELNASMSVGSNSDGGYLAPAEWDRKIAAAQLVESPMRRIATIQTTGVNAFSTLWDSQGWGSGWVGETASRPQTSNTSLAPLNFTTGEIYAMPAVTQRLLDDAQINLAEYLETEVGKEFARQENVAFVSGNGVNKPSGFLTYVVGGTNAAAHPGGALDTVTATASALVTSDELVDFFYGLAAPYRQNASWLLSSTSVAKISKLKDGQGNYLWLNGVLAGQPATLLGRPVEIDENMPAMTAGNLPIAFGDFKAGYLINDRLGTRVLRDPYTNKPFVLFYCTKRVGGGVRDPRAIRVLKMAAS